VLRVLFRLGLNSEGNNYSTTNSNAGDFAAGGLGQDFEVFFKSRYYLRQYGQQEYR